MKLLSLATILVLFTFSAHASVEPRRILSLKQWRENQLIEAQNRVVRLSNRITMIRNTTGNLSEINRLEADRKAATHSAELIGDFTIEDYFNQYLSQFKDNEAGLVAIAAGMSTQETAQLLQLLFKRTSAMALDDSTASSVLTGLAMPSQPGT